MKNIKLFKRCIGCILSAVIMLSVCITGICAAEGQAATVYIDGKKYTGSITLREGIPYVGIREFSTCMGAKYINWDPNTKTATVKSDNLIITATYGESYIVANERYLWIQSGIVITDGTMLLPLRPIAKAFNAYLNWDAPEKTGYIRKLGGEIISGDEFYNADEVYWLSRIINSEAGVEPFLGKIGVGTVVLNRQKSGSYPDTVYGVIFDKKYGVQFTPTVNGTVYNEPNRDSIIAAKLCLDGARINEKVLFFVNDAIAESSWVRDNKAYVTTIGGHNFYS